MSTGSTSGIWFVLQESLGVWESIYGWGATCPNGATSHIKLCGTGFQGLTWWGVRVKGRGYLHLMQEDEHAQHLFFKWNYSIYIWEHGMVKCGLRNKAPKPKSVDVVWGILAQWWVEIMRWESFYVSFSLQWCSTSYGKNGTGGATTRKNRTRRWCLRSYHVSWQEYCVLIFGLGEPWMNGVLFFKVYKEELWSLCVE